MTTADPPDPPPDLAGLADPLPVEPLAGPLDAVVTVPGSKSVTNRALVCAALAEGESVLDGALDADDTRAMIDVLSALGVALTRTETGALTVAGRAGHLAATDRELDVRQSGTTARFVLPMLVLGEGSYRVTAHRQMQARPMGTLVRALADLGARVEPLGPGEGLPATITAGSVRSGVVRIPGNVSSQFLSGLLLTGPCLTDGLVVEVEGPLVSRPYVELTMTVMTAFGAQVEAVDPHTFAVLPGGYRGRRYRIEPDASAASYPLAAAAVAGGRVRVRGLTPEVTQGDVAFADVLAAMGAEVVCDDDGTEIRVEAGTLEGATFDLTDFSDTAPTLAVVAPFARTPVSVTGIDFIRGKEIDRVQLVATELRRLGVEVTVDLDGWTIQPGPPGPGVVQTYEDHRMAMSFALAGLARPGIAIAGPACAAKTFPGYWALLDDLRRQSRPVH